MSNKPSRQASASAKVRAASAGGRSNTMWLWIGLGVLVVGVLVVAIAMGRSSDSGSADGGRTSPSGGTVVPNGDPTDPTVTVNGENLVQFPASPPDPAVGQTIPTISGETFDGNGVTISPSDGPQLILVVAHWCPHCRAEVPRIQEWLDDNGMPSDVEITAIATANDPTSVNYPAGAWLRKEGWSVPTLIDDAQQSAALAVGTSGYPFFVAVDAQGQVVTRGSGELTMDQFDQLIEAARTGSAPTS